MKTGLIIALTGFAIGCGGTADSRTTTGSPIRIEEPGQESTLALTSQTVVETAVVAESPQSLWAGILDVYEELGIEAGQLNQFDGANRRIAVINLPVKRLGGERLSRFLRCGASAGAPKADWAPVQITLATWIEALPEGSRIHVSFDGSARGRSGEASLGGCTSNGRLEREMIEDLRSRAIRSAHGGA